MSAVPPSQASSTGWLRANNSSILQVKVKVKVVLAIILLSEKLVD